MKGKIRISVTKDITNTSSKLMNKRLNSGQCPYCGHKFKKGEHRVLFGECVPCFEKIAELECSGKQVTFID